MAANPQRGHLALTILFLAAACLGAAGAGGPADTGPTDRQNQAGADAEQRKQMQERVEQFEKRGRDEYEARMTRERERITSAFETPFDWQPDRGREAIDSVGKRQVPQQYAGTGTAVSIESISHGERGDDVIWSALEAFQVSANKAICLPRGMHHGKDSVVLTSWDSGMVTILTRDFATDGAVISEGPIIDLGADVHAVISRGRVVVLHELRPNEPVLSPDIVIARSDWEKSAKTRDQLFGAVTLYDDKPELARTNVSFFAMLSPEPNEWMEKIDRKAMLAAWAVHATWGGLVEMAFLQKWIVVVISPYESTAQFSPRLPPRSGEKIVWADPDKPPTNEAELMAGAGELWRFASDARYRTESSIHDERYLGSAGGYDYFASTKIPEPEDLYVKTFLGIVPWDPKHSASQAPTEVDTVGEALARYREQHAGEFPPTMAALGIDPEVGRGGAAPAVRYWVEDAGLKAPVTGLRSDVIVFYEAVARGSVRSYRMGFDSSGWDTHPGGRVVCYADGSPDLIPEDDFKQMMADQNEAFKTRGMGGLEASSPFKVDTPRLQKALAALAHKEPPPGSRWHQRAIAVEATSTILPLDDRLTAILADWDVRPAGGKPLTLYVPKGEYGGAAAITLTSWDPNAVILLTDSFENHGSVAVAGPVVVLEPMPCDIASGTKIILPNRSAMLGNRMTAPDIYVPKFQRESFSDRVGRSLAGCVHLYEGKEQGLTDLMKLAAQRK